MKDLYHLFRWQDGLDILILGFVFYRLYLWMRKKKALRMILVIFALPVYYLVAQWIDLPLSVWSLQNLWAAILLVLVIIFQQEIREVLGSISLPTFLFGKPDKLPSKRIDKVAEASFRLAQRGMGGLIVLQRADDLEEFIHGQTLLDAELNEDVLLSIFHPQSPLHDGGIVISRNRIHYATALLPVSQSPSLPKEWGTRHRAGLGITEVSDAECIIISEERKEVLLAVGGKVEKKENKESLRKDLADFHSLPGERERKKGWMGKQLENLPMKALFLLLVCLLWIFVIGIRQGEISFNIPIEYYSVPKDLSITGLPPKEINVLLRGSQRLLSGVTPDHLRVQIDLTRGRPGTNQIYLAEKNINVPSGISVTSFYPRKIILQLSPIPNSNGTP